jgi:hypothetical protein
MRTFRRTAISLLAVFASSAALAGPMVTDPTDPPRAVISSSGKTRYVIQNPNNCAPWLPEAVYAWKVFPSKLIGYRCYYNSNG